MRLYNNSQRPSSPYLFTDRHGIERQLFCIGENIFLMPVVEDVWHVLEGGKKIGSVRASCVNDAVAKLIARSE